MSCRICQSETIEIVDLGYVPIPNSFKSSPDSRDVSFPLLLERCPACGNIQTEHCIDEDLLFGKYKYITPKSESLEDHYKNLIEFMKVNSFVNEHSSVFEIGSNIGRFLSCIAPSVGKVRGMDPVEEIVGMANEAGVPTNQGYFSREAAGAQRQAEGAADLVVARHCMAHNADVHGLLDGVRHMLAPTGVFVMENAYGLNTILNREIGQIYHEHMYYFTSRPIKKLFEMHGLDLIDIMIAENIHGGSIIFFGAPAGARPVRPAVEHTLAREAELLTEAAFDAIPAFVEDWRRNVRELVTALKETGHSIALYGASAKAVTVMSVVGLDAGDIAFCADSSPTKIGRYLPGTRVPVRSETEAISAAPDYFMITAWNYTDEIVSKVRNAGNRDSGFLTVFPKVGMLQRCARKEIVL